MKKSGKKFNLGELAAGVPLPFYINGEWIRSPESDCFTVHNPANGAVVARVCKATATAVAAAIDAADSSFQGWSSLTANKRADYLLRLKELLILNQDELAQLITLESGKPIAEARGEVFYAAEFVRYFAEEGRRIGGEIIASHAAGKRLITLQQPVGVSGLITIWNFPAAGITRPLAAALAAGCPAIVKPAEQTPVTAWAIFQLIHEAGIPAGVANLLTTDTPAIVASELLRNPLVKKISFTGSEAVGKSLLRDAAGTNKRISLELGGHAPMIVFADADLTAAVKGALLSKFRYSGQTCVALNRIYVHASCVDEFTAQFVSQVKELKVGNPLDATIQIGPLINQEGLDKVQRHIADAVARGARILTGGQRLTEQFLAQGMFYTPTVLCDVNHDMLVMREEIFGPVAPIASFHDEEEVLRHANNTTFGLAAFFYTRDISRVIRMGEKLEFGVIGINDALPGAVHIPFGGVKQSGIGKEGGRLGLEEFLQTKFISVGI